MIPLPTYAQNDERFADFYELQRSLAGHLAGQPELIRAWLEGLPPREPEGGQAAPASKSWRTARLSTARRRDLRDLLAGAEGSAREIVPLAAWLLAAVPVRTYCEIIAGGDSRWSIPGDGAAECHRQLLQMREALFLSNYGLAKAAAKRRSHQDYAEMLSAASDGLLDAIDRYVPGAKAARFAYFAGYWIRYHMARQFQKSGSVVSFPVNQHRIGRRIDRYLAERQPADRPPSAQEVCQELQLGRAAYYWQQRRPHIVSLHGSEGAGAEAPAMELVLCDPAPEPADQLEQAEIADRLGLILRAQAGPATRLMLAYTHGVGALAEAAEDYLGFLEETGLIRLKGDRPDGRSAISSDGGRPWRELVSGETRRNENQIRKEYHESRT